MNWIDLVIIFLLVIFTLESLARGFLSELFDFIGFLLAFFVSLRFYNFVASLYDQQFHIPHSVANVLGFMTIWFSAEICLFIISKLIAYKLRISPKLQQTLLIFAPIPGFLRGVVFVAIILVVIGTFPIQPRIKAAVQQSRIGSVILSQAQGLEGPLKSVFGGISEDTLTFLTIKPRSDESVDLGFKTEDFYERDDLEQQMIELVNRERVSRGLNALVFDDSLRQVGLGHSGDMFKRGYFAHVSPEGKNVADRANALNVTYTIVGENLAYAPTLELAHNGLMNSEGHRANILSDKYNKMGIAILDGKVYGLMITQIFSD